MNPFNCGVSLFLIAIDLLEDAEGSLCNKTFVLVCNAMQWVMMMMVPRGVLFC